VTGSPYPVTSARPNESRGEIEAANAGTPSRRIPATSADPAVGDDADAAAGEHPRRQELAPDRDVEQPGREHDDRARGRRVDRRELVLVGVLEQLVARDRGDRERTPGQRGGHAGQRTHGVLHRLRAPAEAVEHVRDDRDWQRRESRRVELRCARPVHERYTL
jgi:hypothetical protein